MRQLFLATLCELRLTKRIVTFGRISRSRTNRWHVCRDDLIRFNMFRSKSISFLSVSDTKFTKAKTVSDSEWHTTEELSSAGHWVRNRRWTHQESNRMDARASRWSNVSHELFRKETAMPFQECPTGLNCTRLSLATGNVDRKTIWNDFYVDHQKWIIRIE